MLSTDLLRALVRLWYATTLGLLLTAGLCLGAGRLVPVTYQATTDVLLMPPKDTPGANPYLGLSGLREVTEVLSRSLSDDATAQALKEEGARGSFLVERDVTVAGPIILVTAQSDTPDVALATVAKVVDLVPERLRSLQSALDVPTKSMVTSEVLLVDDNATAMVKSRIRAVIAAGALGIVLTLLLVTAADRATKRRPRHRLPAAERVANPASANSTRSAPIATPAQSDVPVRRADISGTGTPSAGSSFESAESLQPRPSRSGWPRARARATTAAHDLTEQTGATEYPTVPDHPRRTGSDRARVRQF